MRIDNKKLWRSWNSSLFKVIYCSENKWMKSAFIAHFWHSIAENEVLWLFLCVQLLINANIIQWKWNKYKFMEIIYNTSLRVPWYNFWKAIPRKIWKNVSLVEFYYLISQYNIHFSFKHFNRYYLCRTLAKLFLFS